jgi:hypothetical protein
MWARPLFTCLFVIGTLGVAHRIEASAEIRSTQTPDEKESRTPAQQKIDTQLLYALYEMRGEAEVKGVPSEPIVLRKDSRGRVLIDIRSMLTQKLISLVKKSGGNILSSSQKDHSLIAYVRLDQLERIAELKEVRFISQPSEAVTN